jgi:hypothetical protein
MMETVWLEEGQLRSVVNALFAHVPILDIDRVRYCLWDSVSASKTLRTTIDGGLEIVAQKLNELSIVGCACLQIYFIADLAAPRMAL